MYHSCSGTVRAMTFTRVGVAIVGAFSPKYAPTKTSGVEMPSHMSTSATSVRNGTAPEEPVPQTKRLSTKKMRNTEPGKASAVATVLSFQFLPPNIL